MTAPCYDSGEQPDGDPWPEDSAARLAIYNRLVRQVAATSPDTSLLNFNAMACPGGHYQEYLDGRQVRLADGVHFTFTGGNVFASRIWPVVAALGARPDIEIEPSAANAGPSGRAGGRSAVGSCCSQATPKLHQHEHHGGNCYCRDSQRNLRDPSHQADEVSHPPVGETSARRHQLDSARLLARRRVQSQEGRVTDGTIGSRPGLLHTALAEKPGRRCAHGGASLPKTHPVSPSPWT